MKDVDGRWILIGQLAERSKALVCKTRQSLVQIQYCPRSHKEQSLRLFPNKKPTGAVAQLERASAFKLSNWSGS